MEKPRLLVVDDSFLWLQLFKKSFPEYNSNLVSFDNFPKILENYAYAILGCWNITAQHLDYLQRLHQNNIPTALLVTCLPDSKEKSLEAKARREGAIAVWQRSAKKEQLRIIVPALPDFPYP